MNRLSRPCWTSAVSGWRKGMTVIEVVFGPYLDQARDSNTNLAGVYHAGQDSTHCPAVCMYSIYVLY